VLETWMRSIACFVIFIGLVLGDDQEGSCKGGVGIGRAGSYLLQVNGSSKVRTAAQVPIWDDLASVPRNKGALDVSYGSKRCPCIGIDHLKGEVHMNGESTRISFPAEVGAHCHAWDDGKKELKCALGQTPGAGEKWCAEEWCFVDPCNCNISTPPRLSKEAAGVRWQGRPLYYSYTTCASIDWWPTDPQDKDVEQKEFLVCEALKRKPGWIEGKHGDKVDKALSREVAKEVSEVGSSTEVVEFGEVVKNVSKYGDAACQCIGRAGLPGTISVLFEKETLQYPAETGSLCKAWDLHFHPACQKESGRPKWCDEAWCYVDPCSCTIPIPPKTSWYLPGATIQGRHIYYSYEACGSEDVYTIENELACVNQDTAESCLGTKTCAWGGTDLKCLGEELLRTCDVAPNVLERWSDWAYTGGQRDSTRFFGPYDATLLIYFLIMVCIFVALLFHIEKISEQGWLQPQERGG